MNPTTTISRPRVLCPLVLFLGALLFPAIQLRALIITTNCADAGASLPAPKEIQSACPTNTPLAYLAALPQFSSGSIYYIFAPSSALSSLGLGQSDANGVFNWKVACSNGFIGPLNAQGRISALQDLPAGVSNVTCF